MTAENDPAAVLECLRRRGQCLDIEIARDLGIALQTVRAHLVTLAGAGGIIMCNLTRFERGKRIEAWQCRVSGYTPPPAPGRKPSPKPQ
jgi:predicted ArsR family transcriptional regulator